MKNSKCRKLYIEIQKITEEKDQIEKREKNCDRSKSLLKRIDRFAYEIDKLCAYYI